MHVSLSATVVPFQSERSDRHHLIWQEELEKTKDWLQWRKDAVNHKEQEREKVRREVLGIDDEEEEVPVAPWDAAPTHNLRCHTVVGTHGPTQARCRPSCGASSG